MEILKLEGDIFVLALQGIPRYGEGWYHADSRTVSTKTKHWVGLGKITNLLAKEGARRDFRFWFVTDTWIDIEKNWDRSLRDAVLALGGAYGAEVFPIVYDEKMCIDYLGATLMEKIKTEPPDGVPQTQVNISVLSALPLMKGRGIGVKETFLLP